MSMDIVIDTSALLAVIIAQPERERIIVKVSMEELVEIVRKKRSRPRGLRRRN